MSAIEDNLETLRKKNAIENFLQLLEEMQEGKDKGKHNNCVFGNTLSNVRDVAVLNGISPEILTVRESWRSYFSNSQANGCPVDKLKWDRHKEGE